MNINKHSFPWFIIFPLLIFFFLSHHNIHAPTTDFSVGSIDKISEATATGDMKRLIALMGLGFVSFLTFFQKAENKINHKDQVAFLSLFFLTWVVLSVTWASDPFLAFRRVVIFCILCISAFAVARRFILHDIVLFAFISSSVYLLIGILTEIFFDEFYPWIINYRFGGTLHPNHQGWNCGTLLISSTVLASSRGRWRPFFIMAVIIAIIFLVLTKSRTTFVGAFIVLIAYLSIVTSKPTKLFVVFGSIIIVLLLYIIIGEKFNTYTHFLFLLGRTDLSDTQTLTGRVPLWTELINYIAKRPLQGYGFNAFWTPNHVYKISKQVQWSVPGAHNDYIELLLGVGIVGFTTYVIILSFAIKRSLILCRNKSEPYSAFCWMILIFYCIVMFGDMISSLVNITSFVVLTLLARTMMGNAIK